MGVILSGILIDIQIDKTTHAEVQEVKQVIQPKREVKIEVTYDSWTPERIEQEIRSTFHEEPNTAVAVVKAEGGLRINVQSHYVTNGVQEPSYCAFQIHAPSWDKKAKQLGYGDYRTNPKSCVAMARVIYEAAGHSWSDWSAYKNGTYKNFL